MKDEPPIREMADNANQPATTGDVEELAALIAKHCDAVDDRFANIERELAAVRNGHQAILDVVQSTVRQLRDSKTILTRVARLKRTVFRR